MMDQSMQAIVNRKLLEYSAGQSIFCPRPECGKVADARHWVLVTLPDGRSGGVCADCWDAVPSATRARLAEVLDGRELFNRKEA